jgi:hypothetical protein
MKKSKFRFSTVVLAPLAFVALTASSSVAVAQETTPPTAVNDFFTVTQTQQNITLNVLANDFDPDGTTLTVNSVSGGSDSGIVIDNDGNVLYTPVITFSGTETFTYTAIDGNGEVSNVATVTITVVPPPSTFNSAIAGNGRLDGPRSKQRKRANTTFNAYYSNNLTLAGQVRYTDRSTGTFFRATEITAVQVFGNTGTIYGFGTLNGVPGVGFVLSTTDQFPSYITQGDTFTLFLGTDQPIVTTFDRGGSRVVGGDGTDDGGGPVEQLN